MPYRAVWSLCNYRRLAAIVSTMITKHKADSRQPCRIPRVICENRKKEQSFKIKPSIHKQRSINMCICVIRIYRQHICWIWVPIFLWKCLHPIWLQSTFNNTNRSPSQCRASGMGLLCLYTCIPVLGSFLIYIDLNSTDSTPRTTLTTLLGTVPHQTPMKKGKI